MKNNIARRYFFRTIAGMKKTRGRPPKAPNELFAERIELRMTADERADYERAAKRSEMTLSAWIRDQLGKAARRGSRKP